ncbi:hypothetical protein F5Y16DRAFT_378135, partial [Xylariaceae sp. FL0255]
MDRGGHIKLLNPTYEESFSFPPFSRLPPELRQEVWRHSLQHPRLISVRIISNQEEMEFVATTNAGIKSYDIQIIAPQMISKLFRANREARAIASRFYRIKLPCWFKKNFQKSQPLQRGMLHLNPEYDILCISRDMYCFVDLLHQIRSRDPLNIGLLNIALDFREENYDLRSVDISILDTAVRTSLLQTLENLQQVFFIVRHNPYNDNMEYHWSRPFLSPNPSYEHFVRDPRSNIDLRRVYVWSYVPIIM